MRYFIILEKLPSLNEVIDKNRANRHAGNKYKQDIEARICMYIQDYVRKGKLSPMGEFPCVIRITWHERTKRRDVDNIQSAQKFILDALQKSGIILNDSRKYVRQIHHEVVDDVIDGVFVEIKECGLT